MATVLIVEDEKEIRRFVRLALEGEALKVFDADTLQRGLIEAATRKPDLVILDLGLPDGDGRDFIRELRQWSAVPVIVLSARVDEQDKIDALDVGADDYLTKPFSMVELIARIRAVLRRIRPGLADDRLNHGDIIIDRVSHRVKRDGKEVH
ncbi:MAG TPA: two-component system response regulator KdpE, partial [Pantoea septica]|nr:two-component system response regulator KdpE [Pantoea septica]